MTRYGQQFGPDFTFLGVPMCDLDDPSTYADAQVVILGAPFDGGTSARSGARFGPMAIRMRDYLPHDGSRPSLALRTDGLRGRRGDGSLTEHVAVDPGEDRCGFARDRSHRPAVPRGDGCGGRDALGR